MNGWRALWRVELRDLRRNRGRSLLVIGLVALPVAAIVGGTTLARITTPTASERQAAAMGAADLHAWPAGTSDAGASSDAARRLAASLPSHATSARLGHARVDVLGGGRKFVAHWFAAAPEAWQGLARGLRHVTEGRPPASSGEVALSPVVLEGLGVEVGDRVDVQGRPCVVTGVVRDPESLQRAVALGSLDDVPASGRVSLLVASDRADEVARRLEAEGAKVERRRAIGGPDGFEQLVLFVVGGIGLFEAALVIAAAFAVGLRRRMRDFGLLSAAGAPAFGVWCAIVASSAVLAGVGGLVGVAVGLAAAAGLHPFLDHWNGRFNGTFDVATVSAVGAWGLGACTAVAAAAVPAWRASRVPVRQALGGRRPVTTPSGRWGVAGVACVGVGIAFLAWGGGHANQMGGLALIAGAVFGVLGFGLASPWILERLARVATPLPLTWRLAVRDAGRFRARNGPVVTAVLAGMAISVTVAALLASLRGLEGFSQRGMPDSWLIVEGPAAEHVAGTIARDDEAVRRAPLRVAQRGGRPVRVSWTPPADDARGGDWVAVADKALLDVLGVASAREALREGALIVRDDRLDVSSLEIASPAGASVPWSRVELRGAGDVPGMSALLSRATCERAGWGVGPPPGYAAVPWVVSLGRSVTDADLEQALAQAAAVAGTSIDARILRTAPERGFHRAVLLICFTTGLVVLCIATALSSVESAADAQVLFTVGAPPSTLRWNAAARTGYLALLGCVLAIPAGMLPAIGIVSMAQVPLELKVPWREVLITVGGLPMTAFIGSWSLSLKRRSPLC